MKFENKFKLCVHTNFGCMQYNVLKHSDKFENSIIIIEWVNLILDLYIKH